MLTFRTLISTPAYTNVFGILVVLLVLTPSAHQIFSLFILSSIVVNTSLLYGLVKLGIFKGDVTSSNDVIFAVT